MSPPPAGERTPLGSILRGVLRIARGRVDGLDVFGGSRQGFIRSLTPITVVAAVVSIIMPGEIPVPDRLTTFFQLLSAFLWFSVGGHFFARLWGREDHWLRYATALNWCQALLPFMLGLVLLVPIFLASLLGLPPKAIVALLFIASTVYMYWQYWFLARHGLGLSGVKSMILVGVILTVHIAVTMLVAQLGGEGHGPMLPDGERT